MPGVDVTTATRGGAIPQRAQSGQFFLTGLTGRGDTAKPILVRGMADVDAKIGPRTSYGAVYDQLKTFFDEGGLQAWVQRVVGANATKGVLNLKDRAGSPLDTVRFTAKSAGAWSGGLSVQVLAGTVTNTIKVVLRLDGTTVNEFNNLDSPAAVVSKFAGNPYVDVTNLGSLSVAPNNLPALVGITPLSAGDDDRASLVSADYVNALKNFTLGLGDGSVSIPGQSGSAVWQGIIDHCVQNRRIGILAGAPGDSKESYVSNASSLNSEYAGLFGPHIVVNNAAGGLRTISPEGFVAACRARAHEQVGPWRAPAGAIGKASTVVNVENDFTKTQANEMDDAKVSVIRLIAGSVRLYGWRSLSNDTDNYSYLKDRDLLNRLVNEAEKRLEDYVFQPIDGKGQLLSAVNAELVGLVDPIRAAGGLFENYDEEGALVDPGYKVDTGNSVNPRASLASNRVAAVLSVRVSPVGALISLNIVKVGILSGL